TTALTKLQEGRAKRFEQMRVRLQKAGIVLPEPTGELPNGRSLGRRYLAELLVESGRVTSIKEAFHRYLGDRGAIASQKPLLEAESALALIRHAGGVASWAPPSYEFTLSALPELRQWGLSAIEAVYPGFKPAQIRELRQGAAANDLVVTGGSDCHGPDSPLRSVG